MSHDTDLHTHSTASDGALTPAELVGLAARAGVRRLALTDHDTLAGLPAVREAAMAAGLDLVDGVEISSSWGRREIHVVGLWMRPDDPELRAALSGQQQRRDERAERIARRLAGKGMPGALEGARREAGTGPITRPHFARWLVAEGHAPDLPTAFRKWLADGRVGHVSVAWPEIDEVISWIRAAGGVAVLAHPLKYRLTATRLRQLVRDFAGGGGGALEIPVNEQDPERVAVCARLAGEFDLSASLGSDFHQPQRWRPMPGGLPDLPPGLTPVWEPVSIA